MVSLLQVVLKLTQMIGKNVKLYDMVLQFLRTLFLRTRNVHYCTLRAELLMSLHDLDITEICSVDPCHKVRMQRTCIFGGNESKAWWSHLLNLSLFVPRLWSQFTWCLDACIREKFVDGKRARELQGFLDGVKKGQEQVLGWEMVDGLSPLWGFSSTMWFMSDKLKILDSCLKKTATFRVLEVLNGC